MTWNLDWWPRKTIGHLFWATSSFMHHFIAISHPNSPETPNLGQNRQFFVPCNLEIWPWMTLKNNRAPLRCYFKLCALFHSHQSIQLELQSGSAKFGSKSAIFLSHVISKFDRWSLKIIGHISYAISSFFHHFITIGHFKLELQSENAKFGSKLAIFLPVSPWNLTDDLEKQ